MTATATGPGSIPRSPNRGGSSGVAIATGRCGSTISPRPCPPERGPGRGFRHRRNTDRIPTRYSLRENRFSLPPIPAFLRDNARGLTAGMLLSVLSRNRRKGSPAPPHRPRFRGDDGAPPCRLARLRPRAPALADRAEARRVSNRQHAEFTWLLPRPLPAPASLSVPINRAGGRKWQGLSPI